MEEEIRADRRPARSPLRSIATFLLIIVVPIAIGLYIAPRLVPEPKVGIVRLNLDINGETAFEVTEQLEYARNDDSIEAVVLVINSPGGSAAYSEELYLDVLNTREELPVVATIDLLGASGAYYMAAAADEIYAKPTSSVGSIGVIAFLPGPAFIEEDLLTSGPYKAFGGTRDGFVRQIEMAKFAFLEAIAAGRGERLETDLSQLSRAEIFNGSQAFEMGLIDGLLSGDEAVQRAADLAGLKNYETVELFPLTFPETVAGGSAESYRPEVVNPQSLWAAPTNLPAGLYYRYVVPPTNQ
jgi:protease-4